MSYNFQAIRSQIFTEEGQVVFLKVRDNAHRLLETAGAFMMFSPWEGIEGGRDTDTMMAYIDRLVELKEIREITDNNVWGQHRVFVKYNQ